MPRRTRRSIWQRRSVIHESEGLHHAWHSRLVESGLGVQGDAADHDEPQRAYGI